MAGLGDVYYPLATVFQWAVVALVLGARRRDASAAMVAVVLGGNGFETLDLFLRGRAVHALTPLVPLVDGLIVLTLPFLASRFPTPPAGRVARFATLAWPLALAGWSAVALLADVTTSAGYFARNLPLAAALLATAALLALRLVPRALRERAGPLRAQSVLVAAGLAAGLAHTTGLLVATHANFLRGVGGSAVELATQISPALAFFLLVAAWRAAFSQRSARDGLAFALLVALGLSLGLLDVWLLLPRHGVSTNELVTQSARPLLVAVAMLRYDLFSVPAPLRRPLVPLTLALALLSPFVLLTVLFSRAGMSATSVDPVAAVGAFAVVAVVAFAMRGPAAEIARSARADDPAAARARIERYRLALERARAAPASEPDLEALRRELGVTRAEKAALESVLDGNLVIPSAALVGASAGSVVAGRYEVVRELGAGGFGRAHLARDRASGAEVVLKEVARPWERDADERRISLETEAAASARVVSPHVARAIGILAEPWQTYLVREFVPGSTVEEIVRSRGALEPARARDVADGVLAGLEALHAAGLLHLDVKPANVVVRPDGVAVLIDQGAARAREDAGADRTRGKGAPPAAEPRGSDALTPRWAAPEQIRGARPTRATDVYGAGVLLYHALTGAVPAPSGGRFEVERAIVEGRALSWPPGCRAPEDLAAVVARATARDPAARFPDAASMRAALGVASVGSSAPGPAARSDKR